MNTNQVPKIPLDPRPPPSTLGHMNTTQTRPAPAAGPFRPLSPLARAILADWDDPGLSELALVARHGLIIEALHAQARSPAFRAALAAWRALREDRLPCKRRIARRLRSGLVRSPTPSATPSPTQRPRPSVSSDSAQPFPPSHSPPRYGVFVTLEDNFLHPELNQFRATPTHSSRSKMKSPPPARRSSDMHASGENPPMVPPRRSWRFLLTLGTILTVAAVLAARSWQLLQPESVELRVAINPWPGYEFAFLAQELGYFEEEGVRVRLIALSSLGDARRAFERGQADGFFGTMVELVYAEEHSPRTPVPIIAVNITEGGDMILAREEITSVTGLRGRRVGVENGSVGVYVLARALELNGMDWSDIEAVHVPTFQAAEDFAHGKIDAAVTYPPMSHDIERTGGSRRIFSSAELPGEVLDLLAMCRIVSTTRRRDVDAFCRAFLRAQQYAAEHPETAYRMMAARQNVSVEEFVQSMTYGIRILGQADQAAYFGDSGKVLELLQRTRNIMARSESPRPGVLLTSEQTTGTDN